MAPNTLVSQEDSPFFTLPVEIRIEIYGYAVSSDSTQVIDIWPRGRQDRLPRNLSAPTIPPIAQTCKQARFEALQVYYEINTFRMNIHLPDFSQMQWLTEVVPANLLSRMSVKNSQPGAPSIKLHVLWRALKVIPSFRARLDCAMRSCGGNLSLGYIRTAEKVSVDAIKDALQALQLPVRQVEFLGRMTGTTVETVSDRPELGNRQKPTPQMAYGVWF